MTRSTSEGRTPSKAVSVPGEKARTGFPSYTAAVRYLDSRTNVERVRPARIDPDVFRLDRMRAILAALGDPERDVKFVHVAGSKGKGSTCEMIASSLGACGYAVGLYTSPHLVDLRERVRLRGEPISRAEFTRTMWRVREAADLCAPAHGEPTFFELMTALALAWYAEQAVDLAVLEVGLGGRLDSTNVVMPEVCALTSIQLEHTALLGDCLAAIAREKAGIMKPGVTAITVPQPPEVMEIFRLVAEETGARLLVLGEDVDYSSRFEASHDRGPHARVSVTSERSSFEHLPVPLRGEHQAENCGLALAVVDKLRERGFETPEREVAIGLAATPAMGRLEFVHESPRILIDGAHNAESVRCLVKAIGATIRYDSMVVIFGCASDKGVDDMLAEVARGADKVIFTRTADNPRAVDPAELQHRFTEAHGKMAQTADTLKDAINIAARAVGREDLICVTGSFYLAGEAKRLLTERKRPRRR